MKINIDIKNKKGNLDVDAERLIEKGMDQHERTWKDKFNTKHNAKKEIMELKHKQNIENKEQDLKKKTFVQEIFDGINNKKQIELEEKRKIEEEKIRIEEERRKKEEEQQIRLQKDRKRLGTFLLVLGLIITIIGFGFGEPESGLQMIGSIGFIACIAGFVLLVKKDKKSKKEKNN